MDLEARVANLERQLRRQRMLLVALGLAVAGAVAVAATSNVAESLQARKFEVVNEDGNAVAILGSTGKHGFLEISTKDGVPIFDVIAHPSVQDTGVLSVRNLRGMEILNVRAGTTGEGLLSVHNQGGIENVIIRGSNDTLSGGEVTVLNALRDARGVVGLRVDAGGAGEVSACPRNGERCRTLIPSN